MAVWGRTVLAAMTVWLLGISVHAQDIDRQQLIPWIEQGLKDGTTISQVEAMAKRQSSTGKAGPSKVANLLHQLLAMVYQAGAYRTGEAIASDILGYAEANFGKEHPQTLISINNLALLYSMQGRYEEAERLFEQALNISKRALGAEHPQTLRSVNNLADLYLRQGRYEEAERLFEHALDIKERILGAEHPQTLISVNNLAALYERQGRYGEAESLLKRALHVHERALGAKHLDTILSVNNLAVLYEKQGRYGEAEPLFKRALTVRERILGAEHPDTILSVNNLAGLYERQGHYGEAERLFKRALDTRKGVLGAEHPQTLISTNNLADLYARQGHYGKAEPLYQHILDIRKRILGAEHPDTILSVNNLAGLYERQGRDREAERLYQFALNLSDRILGKAHPQTLITQQAYSLLLIRLKKIQNALEMFIRLERRLFTFVALQLHTTTQQRVRRLFLSSRASFQDAVFSVAAQKSSGPIRTYASGVMLRWKRLQADEDAYMARLVRTATDSKLRDMGQQLMTRRSQLSQLLNTPELDSVKLSQLLQELEAQEAELAAYSRSYKQHIAALDIRLKDIRSALPTGSALLELRQYTPLDLKTGKREEPRFLALLLPAESSDGRTRKLVDLGPVSESRSLWRSLRRKFEPKVAQKLYQTLFGELDDQLARFDTLYLAPDGFLHLVAFARLVLPDGRYWFERQQLRQVLTGRDLIPLKPRFADPKGLVALGGMDYETNLTAAVVFDDERNREGWELHRQLAKRMSHFKNLPDSGPEVAKIAAYYRTYTGMEPQVWRGPEASEAKLKSLPQPPQVLHFATHGFYLPRNGLDRVRPMALSGLALSGANRGLAGHHSAAKEDGILYALEVSSLNLEGTQLVTLSACQTGRGTLDYSDGVYGLVRAFRIAGSRNVLMTLWNVGDRSTRDFMERFYHHWFSGGMTDAALALDQTRREFLTHPNSAWRDSLVWAPFVLVESR